LRQCSEGKVTRVGAVILVSAGFVALAWGRQSIARTESLLRRLGCRFVLTGVLDGALVGRKFMNLTLDLSLMPF